MKKHLFICFIGLILVACSTKDKLAPTQTNKFELLPQAIKAVVKTKNTQVMKQSYLLLNYKEQEMLWNTKWDMILEKDKQTLSIEQKNIILNIANFVNTKTIKNLFKNPQDGTNFLKDNLNYFKQHFTEEQLYLLIECPYFESDFSIFKSNNYINEFSNARGPIAGVNNCSCYYSLSCGFIGLGSSCLDGKCQKVQGCGIVGTSNCTGTCSK
jgi:hypothetical protein